MAFHGNTTLYLLAGTGLDMENTIWMERFAYHKGSSYSDETHDIQLWFFQWLKAHSVSRGYWYMSQVAPSRGYVDVGRQSLVNDLATAWSQEGLGAEQVNEMLDNPNTQYENGIPTIDYMVWSDDYGNMNFHCAFVDRLEALNMATVRVHFTIDAITSYGRWFYFGPCWIEREHAFQDWDDSDFPNYDIIGTEAEPFNPSDTDMIFEEVPQENGNTYQLEDFGNYDQTFVTSDIRLDSIDYIKPREDYPAFPSFEPAERTEVRAKTFGTSGTELLQRLSIGIYRVDKWDNEVFKELGKYDAFEHILYTYSVPHQLVSEHTSSDLPQHNELIVSDFVPNTTTNGDGAYELDLPRVIRDGDSKISESSGTNDYKAYKPMNAKSYYAPYCYVSVTDCMGSSKEFMPQLTPHEQPTNGGVTRFDFKMESTIAPNIPCALYVKDYRTVDGSAYDPLFTLWQIPAYSMTPNASGWGSEIRMACSQRGLKEERYSTATPFMMQGTEIDTAATAISSMFQAVGSTLGAIMGNVPVWGDALNAAASSLGKGVGRTISSFSSGVSNIPSSIGGGYLGGGVTAANGEAANRVQAQYDSVFGLPKAIGGLPSGATTLSLKHVGYKFFFAHVNTYYMRKVDTYFSIFGYACNQWKYPNINIRRRWCYVKTKVCNIYPTTYDRTDGQHGYLVPMWAQEQIKSRLNSGVTFWNLRWALWGDSDETNEHGAPTEYDSLDSNILFCRFVRNYGGRPDSKEMEDNQSKKGGYCDGFYNPYEVPTI